MPLSPTGKIDRRALPQPERLQLSEKPDSVAPRTDLERQIAAIWMDVLQADGIGIHDNFFELGGHSLKVVQILSRVRNSLGVAIPLRRVFEGPTVADMSIAVLEILSEGLAESELADILGGAENPSEAVERESSPQ
jgi:acyl carrier protein